MTMPAGTGIVREADFNAGPRGPMEFVGFPGDPGFEGLRYGSLYQARMRDRIYSAAAACGGSAVEVGAHIGGTTLHLAQHFRHVHAFEPASSNLECLRYNLELNGIRNVTAERRAISDHDGEFPLYLYPTNNAVGHSLTQAIVRGRWESETVKVATLSESLPDVTDCAFLHIDAEGHDLRVLIGARGFMARQRRRPAFEIEYAPRLLSLAGSSAADLLAWLQAEGYCAYIDAGNNLAPISAAMLAGVYELWRESTFGYLDLYLLPRGERFGTMFPPHPE